MIACWPVGAALAVLSARAELGKDIGTWPRLKRLADAYWQALRHNVPPANYVVNRLWLPEHRKVRDDYLHWTETDALLLALNRRLPARPGADPVQDKLAFHDLCRAHDVPTPQVLAVYVSGKAVRSFADDLPPPRSVWLKPASAAQGRGGERLVWQGSRFAARDRLSLDRVGLLDHIAGHSLVHRCTLVQSLLVNHPSIAPLTNGNIATARIVTGRRRSGEVVHIAAHLIGPVGERIIVQGGWSALIDLTSGRLGPGLFPGDRAPVRRSHPETGACVEGAVVPDWETAKALVSKVHGLIDTYVFLGWDVAFTVEGPMLIEANRGWDAFVFQILMDKPFGSTRFVDVLAEYV